LNHRAGWLNRRVRLSHGEGRPTDDVLKRIEIPDRGALRASSIRQGKSASGRMQGNRRRA